MQFATSVKNPLKAISKSFQRETRMGNLKDIIMKNAGSDYSIEVCRNYLQKLWQKGKNKGRWRTLFHSMY
ncbi:MAG: hypothetical protein OEM28_00985 [Nitrosopumilus sp.]|nr:hypothetical protein [Nitrosopumilus sp.]MDH3486440.1 hypothetical protein [Nitrosopumilus sp.]